MLRTRVIPCLLMCKGALVKTVQFAKFNYIGDPANTCRIFNELEVDELAFLDIRASVEKRAPDYRLLEEIANECFMPVSYGGGIASVEDAKSVLRLGFEKIVINSAAIENPDLIEDIANEIGSQSIIVAIDAKRGFFGRTCAYSVSGTRKHSVDPIKWAKIVESRGAGEILLTAINKEGTWQGFDQDLCRDVANEVGIPVIAHGGARDIKDIVEVVKESGASAVALGNMVVYQRQEMGVLINFPDEKTLRPLLD